MQEVGVVSGTPSSIAEKLHMVAMKAFSCCTNFKAKGRSDLLTRHSKHDSMIKFRRVSDNCTILDAGHLVKTYASTEEENRQPAKESPPDVKKPAASPSAPVEQSGDYFIPILVLMAYGGFSVAMGMALDWDLIFQTLGLSDGSSVEITYDFGK